jgi:hypothetical protein
MLECLGDRPTERRYVLFGAGCGRRVWHLLHDRRSRRAVDMAERYADGRARAGALDAADEAALDAAGLVRGPGEAAVGKAAHGAAWLLERYTTTAKEVAQESAAFFASAAAEAGGEAARTAEEAAQADVLRCVFGNPFRSLAIEPAWRRPDVLRLAVAAYEERSLPSGHLDNARLSVLADALEDAGAAGPLIEHLRSPGAHVRGCHALDAVLGRV